MLKILDVKPEGIASPLLNQIHSGSYEGGFLLWECETDAMTFLQESNFLHNYQTEDQSKYNVLELGCGSGLLGIYLLQQGFKNVCFQDYNEEVLRYWTIPNILLNGSFDFLKSSSFTNAKWANFED